MLITSYDFQTTSASYIIRSVTKTYHQYCPVAHALDLVGERWSLLIARELLHGPLRYTDLADQLCGVPTNVLAARLRVLEANGIVAKRRLPRPAASTVYELTEYGRGLEPVLFALAHWGARSLGPPGEDVDFPPGWLSSALRTAVAAAHSDGRFEFRVGTERASLVDGTVLEGGVEDADAIVETDPAGFYHLLVDGRLEGVRVEGDSEALARLVQAVGLTAALV